MILLYHCTYVWIYNSKFDLQLLHDSCKKNVKEKNEIAARVKSTKKDREILSYQIAQVLWSGYLILTTRLISQ